MRVVERIFQCYVDVGFWGAICGTTTTNVRNVRALLKSGVAGFQCYLSDPDGECGDDKPQEPEKRKAPWLKRSLTVHSNIIPQPSTALGKFENGYIAHFKYNKV